MTTRHEGVLNGVWAWVLNYTREGPPPWPLTDDDYDEAARLDEERVEGGYRLGDRAPAGSPGYPMPNALARLIVLFRSLSGSSPSVLARPEIWLRKTTATPENVTAIHCSSLELGPSMGEGRADLD